MLLNNPIIWKNGQLFDKHRHYLIKEVYKINFNGVEIKIYLEGPKKCQIVVASPKR